MQTRSKINDGDDDDDVSLRIDRCRYLVHSETVSVHAGTDGDSQYS